MTGIGLPSSPELMEDIYDRLAAAIDRAGPDDRTLFLTRLVMVMAHRAGTSIDFADCLAVALAAGKDAANG